MLKDLILANRSYRKFYANKKVSRDSLLELIDLARITPSSKNRQPLKYLLLNEQSETDFLFQQLQWAWHLKDWNGPTIEERPPAYIVMLLDTNLNEYADVDAGISAQTILLGAVEKGMGGCIIRTVNHYEVRKRFQLAEEMKIVLVIAIGYPNQEVRLCPPGKNDEIVYFEKEGIHHVPKRGIDDLIL